VPQCAGSILAEVIAALDKAITERSDDPDEDYRMLRNYAESILSDNGWQPGQAGVMWGRAFPEWVLWRFLRQATLLHNGYDFETARDLGDGPGEYEQMLEQLIADGGLDGAVQRLYADCFGSSVDLT
jgi:hypothetical protein